MKKDSVLRFKGTATVQGATHQLATVAEVEKGCAVSLSFPGQKPTEPVAGHAAGVPSLRPGDGVVVLPTTDGFIVIDRLRGEGEAPAAHLSDRDGRLSAEAESGLELRCGPCSIEMQADGGLLIKGESQRLHIDPDGGITIRSKHATVEASKGVYIRGGRIEFN